MDSKKIWLIRHAQSTSNAGEATLNATTIPITKLGQEQAHLVTMAGLTPDLIVVSPFLRTQQTAQPLQKLFPNISCEVWPLHEFNYLGSEFCQNTTREQRLPRVTNYWKKNDPNYVDGAEAESFFHFIQRIDECYSKIENSVAKNIVIFTHGLVIRWILQAFLTYEYQDHVMHMKTFSELRHFPVPNACIIEFCWETKRCGHIQTAHLQKKITF